MNNAIQTIISIAHQFMTIPIKVYDMTITLWQFFIFGAIAYILMQAFYKAME